MNGFSNIKQSSAVDEMDNDVALQLRSGPETEAEKIYMLEIQSRIRQSILKITHNRISLLAFDMWQKEGCPEPGDALENWLEAEKKLNLETMYPPRP